VLVNVGFEPQPDILHCTYPLPLRAKSARNVYMIHDLGSFFACSKSGGRQLAGGAGTVGVPADGSWSGIRCEDHPRACSHCRIAIAALPRVQRIAATSDSLTIDNRARGVHANCTAAKSGKDPSCE
jgi:hypothetical protein